MTPDNALLTDSFRALRRAYGKTRTLGSILRTLLLTLIAFAAIAGVCSAQAPARVQSESRDAALGYMGTANFLIGRIGRDCLSLVGRPESPQQFVQTWQTRNGKYVAAAAKYMEMRLAEVAAAYGEERRNAVRKDMASRSQTAADNLLQLWYSSGPKDAVCKRAVEMVDTGKLDVSPSSKVFPDLQALVDWAQ